MQTSLIIVDDFFDDPERIREAALELDYPKLDFETTFPGRNSHQRMEVTGLENEVSRIVGENLTPAPNMGHAKCRITLEHDEGRGGVHIDAEVNWSGIIYLSLPDHCRGGTDLFRHIPTGTERAPIYKEELEAVGYTSFRQVIDNIMCDTKDESKWERIMRVPMRFNRLVLLRPWLWHTAGPGFGDRPENGRLVNLLFFNSLGIR